MGRVVIPGFRKIETSTPGGEGTTNYADLSNKPSINNVPLMGNLNTVDLKLTDATLTEEGVPAEAKTVGVKLEEQSTSLIALKKETLVNLLKPIDTINTGGITFNSNGDGTYTLSGKATSDVSFNFGDYGGSGKNLYVACNTLQDGITFQGVTEDGEPFIISSEAKLFNITSSFSLYVDNGTILTNFLFKPMISNRPFNIEDFVPYTGDTGKLNSDVADIKKDIGTIPNLATGIKDNLVRAINWLNGQFNSLSRDFINIIGIVGELTTSSKVVVGAINEVNARLLSLPITQIPDFTTDPSTTDLCVLIYSRPYGIQEGKIILEQNSSYSGTESFHYEIPRNPKISNDITQAKSLAQIKAFLSQIRLAPLEKNGKIFVPIYLANSIVFCSLNDGHYATDEDFPLPLYIYSENSGVTGTLDMDKIYYDYKEGD